VFAFLKADVTVKPEVKSPNGRPGHGWENNIKNFKEIWCKNVDCIYMTRDRVQWQAHVNMKMNHCVP
jgi:hypothetical protein